MVVCPRCGHEILDPDPRFCPRCGYDFGLTPPGPHPEPPGQSPNSAQPKAVVPAASGAVAEEAGFNGRYYLLALLTVVGGVIGYRAAKKYNPRVAATIFTISLLVTLVYMGAGYEVYSSLKGPTGTPDLVITGVTFPNSTAVEVTISNQGTLQDGLESVAINNGSLWLVYGLLSPASPQASSEIGAGNLSFSLYGFILNNGTDLTYGGGQSATVGTEGLPPGHVDEVWVPFTWTPLTNYTVFISTSSRHPDEVSAVSPVLPG